MAKTVQDILDIVRQVTNRVDTGDPQWTDGVMIDYVNDFYQLIMPQDLPFIENRGFYEFTTTASTDEYDFPNDTYVLLQGPAYIDGYVLNWYQDPSVFYSKWPETTTYTETRPTDVLLYDNKLLLRAPPDDAYDVTIDSYKINSALDDTADEISQDYWFRYIAYGTALDIFSDYGEEEHYQATYPKFIRYKNLAKRRTERQLINQRSRPSF